MASANMQDNNDCDTDWKVQLEINSSWVVSTKPEIPNASNAIKLGKSKAINNQR